MVRKKTVRVGLKKPREFGRVYRHGRKLWNHAFVVYLLPTTAGEDGEASGWRYGITASKKVGNAVHRNRAKRMVRESLRLAAELVRDGFDIVVVVRRPAVEVKCPEAQRLLLSLLARGGALKKGTSSPAKRAEYSDRCFRRPSSSSSASASTPAGTIAEASVGPRV